MPGSVVASSICCTHYPRGSAPQDFLNRVNLDTEGMARSVPPSVRMLCLHGTADKTIPWQVRTKDRAARLRLILSILRQTHAGIQS